MKLNSRDRLTNFKSVFNQFQLAVCTLKHVLCAVIIPAVYSARIMSYSHYNIKMAGLLK